MKRSKALIPLSREHHHALVVAKRILALEQKPEKLLITYWREVRAGLQQELEQHFVEEERGFKNLLSGAHKQRFTSDHQELRELLEKDDTDAIIRFAQCLKEHVRFEERDVFGWLETNHSRQLAEAFLAD